MKANYTILRKITESVSKMLPHLSKQGAFLAFS